MILFCLFGLHAWSDIPRRAVVFDQNSDPKKRMYVCHNCGQVRAR
jgi:hypothetical protein